MRTRKLRDIEVSEVGMGCMAFSHGYGKIPSESYSIEAIQNAYRHGCTFFDTAEIYSPNLSGTGHNERIVGKALKEVRGKVVIATKLMPSGMRSLFGSSMYQIVRKHLEASMERLQTDMVDLYYLHRTNGVSVEKVAEAMGQLIDEGLIRGWGLSQVDVDVIDRAHRITPLSAIQNIYSMVERIRRRGSSCIAWSITSALSPFLPLQAVCCPAKSQLRHSLNETMTCATGCRSSQRPTSRGISR